MIKRTLTDRLIGASYWIITAGAINCQMAKSYLTFIDALRSFLFPKQLFRRWTNVMRSSAGWTKIRCKSGGSLPIIWILKLFRIRLLIPRVFVFRLQKGLQPLQGQRGGARWGGAVIRGWIKSRPSGLYSSVSHNDMTIKAP